MIRGMEFVVGGEADEVTVTSFVVYVHHDGGCTVSRTLHVRGSSTRTDPFTLWYPSLAAFCRRHRVTYSELRHSVLYATELARMEARR